MDLSVFNTTRVGTAKGHDVEEGKERRIEMTKRLHFLEASRHLFSHVVTLLICLFEPLFNT